MLQSTYHRYRQLIPTLLLSACCLSAIQHTLGSPVVVGDQAYDFALSSKHYAAFALIFLTLCSFFLARQYYRYLLGCSLFLGLINLIYFTANQTSIGLGFGSLSLSVNLAPLLISIVAYLLNFVSINTYLLNLLKPSPAKIATVYQADVAQFKQRFARKSAEELTQLVATNKLVPAALTAARQLLQERA